MKSFIAVLFIIGCASLAFAAPSKSFSWRELSKVPAEDIETSIQNHETVKSILVQLVHDLKDKDAAKYGPALENAVKQLTEVLPKVQFDLMINMVKGIAKEAQDLAKKLSASSDGAKKDVKAFIKERSYDIKSIDGSRNHMNRLLKNKKN